MTPLGIEAKNHSRKNFIVGLDHCLCKVEEKAIALTESQAIHAEEVPGAKDWVNKLVEEGHFICLFTSRPEKLRTATEVWLNSHGFKYDSIIFGKPLAKTYHYIDDRHVQATTFRGKYSRLVRRDRKIEVFG